MKAMILAAGRGTRLRPLTDAVPKPLLPLQGQPLIVRQIELLRRHGVREIAINISYQPDAIPRALGDGSALGVAITYSVEAAPLGTAGAVKRMEAYFASERFFVLCGDVLTDIDLSGLCSYHVARGAALTMALYRPPDIHQCGAVRVGRDGHVTGFVEKPAGSAPSPWANAGIYVVEPAVLRQIPDGAAYDFGHDLIPRLLRLGLAVCGYTSGALVVDIGTREGYRRAQAAAGRLAAARSA